MKKLNNCPTDSISCIRFTPSSNTLMASSWDSNIYLYTLDNLDCIQTYKSRGPILCCDFTSDTSACSAGLDCELKVYDLIQMKDSVIGRHLEAVSCLRWSADRRCIVTGSWDGTIALWDPLVKPNGRPVDQASLRKMLPENTKVYSLDVLGGTTVLAATNTLQIALYDIRKLDQPLEIRDSNLKFNLRCVCALPSDHGFASGCIEGRVSVDLLDPNSLLKPYCFKCHRKVVNNINQVFPVNALAVHPTKSCLVTGGGDKAVYFWDYKSKKRLSYLRDLPSSVSSLAFNNDGSVLAIATSYLYENGQQS
ncbi:hypothetical protein JH06_2586 [Blastocystis sp. subtype 4]|uniref:hypothetical protein n=1 Tax=Blastocystis sp. subtype 4 TaxID=944170 RepID=UPI000711A2D5|nr:hypothetical protein JH06_2586 [Blastocystis sp. subtype 4]KNB43804.1 hypothetical protein JH06_2586 [Blastocystis sp. subtype 4]|eukprot:XP_014527247.1 hypothetical protein JH06_2586 [Blastocystis sp. subtype 4]